MDGGRVRAHRSLARGRTQTGRNPQEQSNQTPGHLVVGVVAVIVVLCPTNPWRAVRVSI